MNHAGQLICLGANWHERDRAGLIDKPSLKSKVQWNDDLIYHGSYRALNKLKFYFPLKKL